VNDELHAAGLIKETLEHDFLERRQISQRGVRGREVLHDLRSGCGRDADVVGKPAKRGVGVGQARFDLGAQA
jgi:hypothetical protein